MFLRYCDIAVLRYCGIARRPDSILLFQRFIAGRFFEVRAFAFADLAILFFVLELGADADGRIIGVVGKRLAGGIKLSIVHLVIKVL